MTLDGSAVNVDVSGLYGDEGLSRGPVQAAGPGDVVAPSGIDRISIGETVSASVRFRKRILQASKRK